MLKKILVFLGVFISFFFSSIFIQSNPEFYNSLVLPPFAPPAIAFGIVWPILYALIALVVTKIFDQYGLLPDAFNFYFVLIVNYFLNQLFTYFFFDQQNFYLAFVDTLFTFITSILLFYEAFALNKKWSYLLIPYVLWTAFASILAFSVLVLN